MPAYDPPLDRLLALDPPPGFGAEWPDYLALGPAREHVPTLLRMATDPALDRSDDERERWAPVHARRALGQLGDAAAAGPLVELLPGLDEYDDLGREELAVVLGMLGPEALPALAAFLGRRDVGHFDRSVAADAVAHLARRYPDARAECVAVLAGALAHHTVQDPELNGLLVASLLDVQAVEAADVMERAYAAGDVDVSIPGDWEDARIALGLLDARLTTAPNQSAMSGLSAAKVRAEQRSRREAERQAARVPEREARRRSAEKSKRKQAAASRRRNRRRK